MVGFTQWFDKSRGELCKYPVNLVPVSRTHMQLFSLLLVSRGVQFLYRIYSSEFLG